MTLLHLNTLLTFLTIVNIGNVTHRSIMCQNIHFILLLCSSLAPSISLLSKILSSFCYLQHLEVYFLAAGLRDVDILLPFSNHSVFRSICNRTLSAVRSSGLESFISLFPPLAIVLDLFVTIYCFFVGFLSGFCFVTSSSYSIASSRTTLLLLSFVVSMFSGGLSLFWLCFSFKQQQR